MILHLHGVFFDDTRSESSSTSPQNISVSCEDDDLPTVETIVGFMNHVFEKAQLVIDSLIISLIYLERFLTVARFDNAGMTPRNWKTLLFMSLALASKMWDDLAMENGDLAVVWSPTSLQRINELERKLLETLRYNVKVSASEYTRYYFTLRELVSALQLPGDEVYQNALSKPLSSSDAAKLEALSSRYANRSIASIERLKLGRSRSEGAEEPQSSTFASVEEVMSNDRSSATQATGFVGMGGAVWKKK